MIVKHNVSGITDIDYITNNNSIINITLLREQQASADTAWP